MVVTECFGVISTQDMKYSKKYIDFFSFFKGGANERKYSITKADVVAVEKVVVGSLSIQRFDKIDGRLFFGRYKISVTVMLVINSNRADSNLNKCCS